MSFDVSHRHTETVTIRNPTGTSNYGDLTYGEAKTIKVRTERSTWARDEFREREIERFDRFSTLDSTIGPRTLVWFDGEDTDDFDIAKYPERIDVIRALDGELVHYVIHLGT